VLPLTSPASWLPDDVDSARQTLLRPPRMAVPWPRVPPRPKSTDFCLQLHLTGRGSQSQSHATSILASVQYFAETLHSFTWKTEGGAFLCLALEAILLGRLFVLYVPDRRASAWHGKSMGNTNQIPGDISPAARAFQRSGRNLLAACSPGRWCSSLHSPWSPPCTTAAPLTRHSTP